MKSPGNLLAHDTLDRETTQNAEVTGEPKATDHPVYTEAEFRPGQWWIDELQRLFETPLGARITYDHKRAAQVAIRAFRLMRSALDYYKGALSTGEPLYRPMNAAPKDGTDILVYAVDKRPVVVYWFRGYWHLSSTPGGKPILYEAIMGGQPECWSGIPRTPPFTVQP